MKNILTIIFILTSIICEAQAGKDSLVLIKFSDKCIGTKLKIKVPMGHDKPKYNYSMEGGDITILYPDKSEIWINCDWMADISIGDKKPDLFYRKEKVGSVTFIYQGVPKDKVYLFDKAFDLLKSEVLTK